MQKKESVLITGTSRGLGRALVDRYVARGFVVYGCARQSSAIVHPNYKHFVVDVCDEFGVATMLKEIASFKLPLNLLINNAGITQASLGILTRGESAQSILNTNLLGTFFVSREALKLMQRQRYGRIINFSSINVKLSSIGSSMYNASKAGVDALGKTLARECGNSDITINTLGLSVVEDSGMLESLSEKALAEKQQSLLKPEPISIDEIVHAIDFFCSPLSSNMTCQTVYFGGL